MKNQLVVWLVIPLLFLFLQISASEKHLIKPYERPIESTHQQIRWYQCLFLRTQKKLSAFLTQLILAYLTFTPSSPTIPLGYQEGGLDHGRLSPNGHWFLGVPMAQSVVYLLDVTASVRIRTFTAPTIVYSCALATRPTFIAGGGMHLYLWDTQSGNLITILPNDEGFITVCHIFCNDTKIMTAGDNQKIIIWQKTETRQWACVNVLCGHTAEIWGSKVSNNNDFIVSMDGDLNICVWKSRTADDHHVKFLTGHSEVFDCHHVLTGHSEIFDVEPTCVFSDDTRYIGSITYSGEIKLWDISSGTCIRTVVLRENPMAVLESYQISYTSAERILWWTAHRVGMWNFTTNKQEYVLLFDEETHIVNVSVSGNRQFLIIVQKSLTDNQSWMKIYHFTSGNPLV